MLLSVIIPVYNEQETLGTLLQRVMEVPYSKEIIVVNDGSTDSSAEILKQVDSQPGILVLHHDRNQGKGAAVRTALKQVTGDIIIQYSDLEYDPQQYPKLIQPILEGKADVVYGSRFVTGDYRRVIYFWHMVGNTVLTFISNMLTNLNLTDMETCYKIFVAKLLKTCRLRKIVLVF